jgi:SNF2 family DNA or RNA helicase
MSNTTINVKNNLVQIFTDYENKDICKSLSSRLWNPAAKCWESPVSIIDEVIRKFSGATLTDSAKAITQKVAEIKTMASNAVGHTELPTKPGLKLYPFQVAGVEFLNATEGSAMIADEMGLGKTVQALEYLYIHPEMRPAMIVCPASLKINWEREATKWLEDTEKIQVINGKPINPDSTHRNSHLESSLRTVHTNKRYSSRDVL